MGNVRIRLDRGGIKALLNAPEVEALVKEHAAAVAGRAGDGYEAAPPHRTGQRWAANVYPATREAAIDNLENNTLLRAIGGGI